MPTKKDRYMIILDEVSKKHLQEIMKQLNTKQQSKALAYCIEFTYQNDLKNL